MNPCSCIELSSALRAQLESLANAFFSLSSNFYNPATDSGTISTSQPLSEHSDNSFNDNLNTAFYLMILIMSIFMIGRIFSNFTRHRNSNSSKLN